MHPTAPWCTVVIPTRDSARWIGVLIAHYQARGFTPTILLDSRTRDETRAIATGMGASIVDAPNFSFTEALVSLTKGCVRTPWALFMHDDEFPSRQLFERLSRPPPPDSVQSAAIPRRWAWFQAGQPLCYGQSRAWPDRAGQAGADHSWRLFRPGEVTFIARMHTEGFLIDRWCRFPLDAYVVHFEWVIRNRLQRAVKVRMYDRQRYGYGAFFENMYLPEDQPAGVITYQVFDTDEFDTLAEAYWAVPKPATLRLPPRTLREQAGRLKSFFGKMDFSAETKDRSGLAPRLELEVPDSVASLA